MNLVPGEIGRLKNMINSDLQKAEAGIKYGLLRFGQSTIAPRAANELEDFVNELDAIYGICNDAGGDLMVRVQVTTNLLNAIFLLHELICVTQGAGV